MTIDAGDLKIPGAKGRNTIKGSESVDRASGQGDAVGSKAVMKALAGVDRRVQALEGDIGQVLKVVLAFETPLVTTAKMLGSLDMAVQSLQETQKKPFPAQPKVEHLTDKPNPTPQRSRSPPKSGSGSSSQSDALEKRLDRLEGGMEKALTMLASVEKTLSTVPQDPSSVECAGRGDQPLSLPSGPAAVDSPASRRAMRTLDAADKREKARAQRGTRVLEAA